MSVYKSVKQTERHHCPWTKGMAVLPSRRHIILQAFAATDFSVMFSGRQPSQGVKFSNVSGTKPGLILVLPSH
jgi:hypothetical protein